MPSGASEVSCNQTTEPSTVGTRPLVTAASIDATTRDSTGSGQPARQHAPLWRHA
jgi:hypothetical protein